MKIALVTSSFLPRIGGAELVVHNLAQHWSLQGHEVCVFNALTDKAYMSEVKYSVSRYRLLRGSTRFGYHRFPFQQIAVRNLQRAITKFQPDFISAHFGYPVGVWLSQMNPIPRFLITCHGRELTKFSWGYRNIYKIDNFLTDALNKSSGAVAISSHARELMEEMGVIPENILDIPNGVDIRRFQKQVDFDFRSQFGISEDAKIILSVGREHPQKAFDRGIKAFSKISDKIPNTYYVILGRNTKIWQSLVNDLRLHNRVILCEGLQGDSLVGAYQQSDIFFSSSVWEMMPLVVLEALAAGLPLVVTDVSGSQDIVQTGENGIIVEPGRLDQMADALYQIISDESLRKNMAMENPNRAKYYSWDNICKLYLEHA